MKKNDDIVELLQSLSPRTKNRIREEVAKGDYSRIARLYEQRVIRPQYRADNQGRMTAYRKARDISHGIIPADRPEFVAWDGEGWEENEVHKYALLANSNGSYLQDSDGLDTEACLRFMVTNGQGRRINIFYSFGYDIQQIIKDLPDDSIERLMQGERTRWRSWTLEYYAGKIFIINNYVRFYDVFPFFHTSFLKAIEEAFGKERITDSLREGKEARGEFLTWDIAKIRSYNDEELQLLRELGEWLRTIFEEAGINLGKSYYGPGAIAKFWFKKYKIAPIPVTSPVLNDIFERAYFGGRFETISMGRQTPVFEYDIHSAYPAAIRELQYVDDWISAKPTQFRSSSKFSVWHVEWHLPSTTRIGPFPSRDKNGLISFPANGRGWYYKPEIEAGRKLYGVEKIKLIEGYVPQFVGTDNPFWWVEEMYNRRAELKAQKNPAQMALKLGLNSLYGKTAQRVGTNTYFCLPWAGWITSFTRSKLLLACIGSTDAIIGFATDGIYSTSKLSCNLSTKLGDWEGKHWNEGYFLQSGIYRLPGESPKDRSRGFAPSNVEVLFKQLADPGASWGMLEIWENRFITHSLAIKFPKAFGPHRLRFMRIRKLVAPYKPTKRALAEPLKYHHVWPWYEQDEKDWNLPEPQIQVIIPKGMFHPDQGYIGYAWPNHGKLLTEPVETRILLNHNDHKDPIYGAREVGPFEESYPFIRKTSSLEKKVDLESDAILDERLGGVSGDIKIREDVPILTLKDY